MLQVVFGESERGTISHALRLKHKEDQEKLRGKPLIGKDEDVIFITNTLDIGDIDCSLISDIRKEIIIKIICENTRNEEELSNLKNDVKLHWDMCVADYEMLLKRAKEGETVQIWYSDAPYSLCGFYNVLYELKNFDCKVTAIKLPQWEATKYGIKSAIGWHEIAPGDWASYLPLEIELTKPERIALAHTWDQLKKENAPLRASINGQLLSVGIDFYDYFIHKEIPEGEFRAGNLIGNVLGKYRLSISSCLIMQRIRSMIESRELNIVRENINFYECILKSKS